MGWALLTNINLLKLLNKNLMKLLTYFQVLTYNAILASLKIFELIKSKFVIKLFKT